GVADAPDVLLGIFAEERFALDLVVGGGAAAGARGAHHAAGARTGPGAGRRGRGAARRGDADGTARAAAGGELARTEAAGAETAAAPEAAAGGQAAGGQVFAGELAGIPGALVVTGIRCGQLGGVRPEIGQDGPGRIRRLRVRHRVQRRLHVRRRPVLGPLVFSRLLRRLRFHRRLGLLVPLVIVGAPLLIVLVRAPFLLVSVLARTAVLT